jgi:hypothetical protein
VLALACFFVDLDARGGVISLNVTLSKIKVFISSLNLVVV